MTLLSLALVAARDDQLDWSIQLHIFGNQYLTSQRVVIIFRAAKVNDRCQRFRVMVDRISSKPFQAILLLDVVVLEGQKGNVRYESFGSSHLRDRLSQMVSKP